MTARRSQRRTDVTVDVHDADAGGKADIGGARRKRPKVSPRPKNGQAALAARRTTSKAVTQQRILNAALSLFAEHGYDRADVRTIAARAGVSHSAVFWHFGSKQRLFQEASRQLLRPFLDQLAMSLQQDDPRKRLFDLFGVYEHFVFENRDAIKNIVRWLLESHRLRASLQRQLLALHESFTHDVRDTLSQFVGDPNEAAELAAALVSLLHGNLLLSLIDPSAPARELRRAGVRTLGQLLLQSPAAAGSGADASSSEKA
jgi:AcrR family transcriptional regulator